MRIAVPGAGGFVGQAVARKAKLAGHDIRAVVRNPQKRVDLRLEVFAGLHCDS